MNIHAIDAAGQELRHSLKDKFTLILQYEEYRVEISNFHSFRGEELSFDCVVWGEDAFNHSVEVISVALDVTRAGRHGCIFDLVAKDDVSVRLPDRTLFSRLSERLKELEDMKFDPTGFTADVEIPCIFSRANVELKVRSAQGAESVITFDLKQDSGWF
jgi:hypothetical protein